MDWQENNVSSIADFYCGKSIFVTGGTGFLGKVLIEKLLYSCKDINKIYILMREKRNQCAEERVGDMIDSPLFAKLKQTRPEALHKLVCVSGDMVTPELGIREEDVEKLTDEVSVVFHLAATVKFNEPLKVALDINVDGTSKVLNLCKRMKNIKAFVHVSTAYSNCPREVIDEVIYPPPADMIDVKKVVKIPDNEKEVDKLLSDWPNTYTFTKALAENYVADNHSFVPTVIIRPSIITAIKNGPTKGWVDNWYGMTGIVTAIAKGFLRVLLGKNDNVLDIIPVDYVANLMIVSAAQHSSLNNVKVLHSSSSSTNPIKLKNVVNLTIKHSVQKKLYDLPPSLWITSSMLLVNFLTFMIQMLPAYIADFFRMLLGGKGNNVSMQTRIVMGRDATIYFTSRSWTIHANGAKQVLKALSPEDQQEFWCDASDIDWSTYLPIYLDGICKYLMK